MCRSLLPPLLGALALASELAALDPERQLTQFSRDSWSRESGLPQSSVMAIAEGGRAELWIGTQEGLVRFDGHRFESYEELTGEELPGPHVLALLVDRSGALWIGTDSGLVRRGSDGTTNRWNLDDGLPANAVFALAEGRDRSVWIGTQSGLARVRDGRVESIETGGEPLETIYALLVDGHDRLWIGTAGRGLRILEQGGGAWSTRLVGPADSGVYALTRLASGTIAAAVGAAGVLEIDPDHPDALPSFDRTLVEHANTLAAGADGSLWVGDRSGGIARRHRGRASRLDGSSRLSSSEISALHLDRDGSLWIGTDGDGLHRFSDGALVPWGIDEGLADDIALVALGAPDGTVWLGTENGGLSRLVDGRIENLAGRSGVPKVSVLALARAADGALWFGTKGAGLCRWADERAECSAVGVGLARGSISALHEDRAGALWVGTPEGLYRRTANGFEPATRDEPLASGFVLAIAESASGRLRVGTYGAGTFERAPGESDWKPIETPIPIHATAFLEEADGTLFVATAGQGLLRQRGGSWTRFTRRDGLPDETLYSLQDDGAGQLWASSNHGVVRIARASLEGTPGRDRLVVRLFDRFDGARSSECNGGTQPAATRDRDGRLWFPTLRGFVSVAAATDRRLRQLPETRLARVRIDGQSVPFGDALRVPSGSDRIELRLGIASLRSRARLGFRHRLEGYDGDWMETDAAGEVLFRRLPAGSYRFEAIAHDIDGTSSPAPIALAIEVEPRWHETLAFRLLAVLASGLLLYGLFRLRMRGLVQRERTLASLVTQRTSELAEANRRLEGANEELQRLSTTDALTALANRRRFDEQLELEWRRAARTREPLAMLLADIDAFKAYNDSLGHPEGDRCLERVARALDSSSQRAGDLVARLGGEEFAVLLPGTSVEQAAAIAARLRAAIEQLAIAHPASPVAPVVTVSIGVAALPHGRGPASELVALADRALYRAKSAGRNRVEVESPSSAAS